MADYWASIYDPLAQKNSEPFQFHLWKGIPKENGIRRKLWNAIVAENNEAKDINFESIAQYEKQLSEEVKDEINLQLDPFYFEGFSITPDDIERIRRILVIHTAVLRINGYIPGSAQLLARILSIMETDQETYNVYSLITKRIREYLKDDGLALRTDVLLLADMVATFIPDLCKHFNENGFDILDLYDIIYIWITPVYAASKFSFQVVARLIDISLIQGPQATLGYIYGLFIVMKGILGLQSKENLFYYIIDLPSRVNPLNTEAAFNVGYELFIAPEKAKERMETRATKDWIKSLSLSGRRITFRVGVGDPNVPIPNEEKEEKEEEKEELAQKRRNPAQFDLGLGGKTMPAREYGLSHPPLLNVSGGLGIGIGSQTLGSPASNPLFPLPASPTAAAVAFGAQFNNPPSPRTGPKPSLLFKKNDLVDLNNALSLTSATVSPNPSSLSTPSSTTPGSATPVSSASPHNSSKLQPSPVQQQQSPQSSLPLQQIQTSEDMIQTIERLKRELAEKNELLNVFQEMKIQNSQNIPQLVKKNSQSSLNPSQVPSSSPTLVSVPSTSIASYNQENSEVKDIDVIPEGEERDDSISRNTETKDGNVAQSIVPYPSSNVVDDTSNLPKKKPPSNGVIPFSELSQYQRFPCLYMEGWLMKARAPSRIFNRSNSPGFFSNLHRRFLVLQGSFLTYFKSSSSKVPSKDLSLDMRGRKVIALKNHAFGPYGFQINHLNKDQCLYLLFARSSHERDVWVQVLTKASQMSYN